jgi:hypothetical protein
MKPKKYLKRTTRIREHTKEIPPITGGRTEQTLSNRRMSYATFLIAVRSSLVVGSAIFLVDPRILLL